MSKLVVAFPEEKKRAALAEVLRRNAIVVDRFCSRAQPALSALRESGGGVLLCPSFLCGTSAAELAVGEKDILFLVIDHCDRLPREKSDNLYFVPEPFRYAEVATTVQRLLWLSEQKYNGGSKRSPEEEKVIRRAKKILMERYAMSENEAYHYLRRKAMSHHESLANCGKRFLLYFASRDNLK